MLLRCSERYGNILNVDTTGALEATVKPDGLSCVEKTAEEHGEIPSQDPKVAKAGNGEGLAPAVIAGITFQESHAGTVLRDGLGDHGNAFGLMQECSGVVMLLSHFQGEHLAQGTEILYRMTNPEKIPSLDKGTTPQRLSGLSACNAGVNTVQTYDKMDIGKTHNYANDVDARARLCKRNG
uniref:Lysozyme g n=1 Tax=Cyanoderma ruficeps TaxID=181631 RepID=A0A8C3NWB9_9PASS